MRQEEIWDLDAAQRYDTPGTGMFAPEGNAARHLTPGGRFVIELWVPEQCVEQHGDPGAVRCREREIGATDGLRRQRPGHRPDQKDGTRSDPTP